MIGYANLAAAGVCYWLWRRETDQPRWYRALPLIAGPVNLLMGVLQLVAFYGGRS